MKAAFAGTSNSMRHQEAAMGIVREVMASRPVTTRPDDTVHEAARRMHELGVESLPVCDEAGRLAGVLTERDIVRRCVAAGHDATATPVSVLASGAVLAVDADDSWETALSWMIDRAVRRLLVTEHGRLVGEVSQVALVDALPPATVRRLVAPRSSD